MRLKLVASTLGAACVALAVAPAHATDNDRYRIARGYEIAPVPLDLRGLDRNLVGLGSYLVNAAGGCNDCHTNPPYATGGDPFAGQRKRIGIARTLILKPEIMLYDEPTAGLDPITCLEINQLINEVKEKYQTSSIIITHDLTCARETGDRVAMLLDGKFLKTGTFEEVFDTDEERIKSFYDYNFIQ